MHQQSGWTATPSILIGAPTSAISTIVTQHVLPYTTLPIYPGLGQAPNMLTDINVTTYIIASGGQAAAVCIQEWA